MDCVIIDCAKPAHSRGWCHAHYKKWYLHGDPLHGKTYSRGRGEGTITAAGYVAVMDGGRKRQQHVLVMEAEVGYALLPGEVVHHRDRNRQNNSITNLVLCASQGQHQELHLQEAAMEAGAPPNYRKCVHCKQYDNPSSMTRTGNNKSGHRHYHKECRTAAEYQRTHK